jgi:hypothetical protein
MALGSTQSLTEISTRNLPCGKWRPARKADKLTAICELTVSKMWEPRCVTTLWVSKGCYMDRLLLFLLKNFSDLNRQINCVGSQITTAVVMKSYIFYNA